MGLKRKVADRAQAPESSPAPGDVHDERMLVVFARAWRHDGHDYADGDEGLLAPDAVTQLRAAGALR